VIILPLVAGDGGLRRVPGTEAGSESDMAASEHATVGTYLAARLAQIGVRHYFVVPGDYKLALLDELLKQPGLAMISCCNELNAGYAADGYARATGGPAAVVVTYSVGGLSALNAVAGAYAEDLPVIVISGSPNTNSTAEWELLHHTLGKVDYGYQRRIFENVTVAASLIHHPLEAPRQIDQALNTALVARRPVYLEIACNIAAATTSAPHRRTFGDRPAGDRPALASAVKHAAARLNDAVKPVLLGGARLRAFGGRDAFRAVAEAGHYAVATMPDAKSFFPEQHPNYIGTYWGPVSSPGCAEIVDAADLCLAAGARFTDYTTVGHAGLIERAKLIAVEPECVMVDGQCYNGVPLAAFLERLAPRLERNGAALEAFSRIGPRSRSGPAADPDAPATTRALFARIQRMLDARTTLIVETGDSWFNGTALDLPDGAAFEIQMQYGSIGWSVGAALGCQIASAPARRVIALVGDGSFQMTAQEVSTMIRYRLRPIVVVINNGGYTIEVEIHDGPYNPIKNWHYARLVEVFNADGGAGWGARVTTEGELDAAIEKALAHDGPSLIEVVVDRDDCSERLLEWGARVARNNGRPPRFAQ
jgi:pyruvate decarboxylase